MYVPCVAPARDGHALSRRGRDKAVAVHAALARRRSRGSGARPQRIRVRLPWLLQMGGGDGGVAEWSERELVAGETWRRSLSLILNLLTILAPAALPRTLQRQEAARRSIHAEGEINKQINR